VRAIASTVPSIPTKHKPLLLEISNRKLHGHLALGLNHQHVALA
jgi:hypothetical protein